VTATVTLLEDENAIGLLIFYTKKLFNAVESVIIPLHMK
jgi:hypothetical protein